VSDYTKDIGKTVLVRQENLFLQGELYDAYQDERYGNKWFVVIRVPGLADDVAVELAADATYRVIEPTFAEGLDSLADGSVLTYGVGENKTTYVKHEGTWHTLGFGVSSDTFTPELTKIVFTATKEDEDA
jgi:hypothetical protein